MTPAGLPTSIAGLRKQLLMGHLSVEEALARQRMAFATNSLHCSAALLAPPTQPPDVSLPLAGIGLAHKDIFVLADRRPGCGAPEPARQTRASGTPATLVQRLNAAGSAPLAALVMAEHACGATGENPHFPLPVNPVDRLAAVGGSSSGSAVAVAAGLCYGSLGTDTAGSVRIPAATCGVLGFKPARGLLPAHGILPLAPSLDTAGILARSAADMARLLQTLIAPSQAQRLFPRGVDALAEPAVPAAWHIATCWDHPDPGVSLEAEVRNALQGLVDALPPGAAPVPVALPDLPAWARLADTLLHSEAAATHHAALRGDAPALTRLTRNVALAGTVLPAAWYVGALRQRGLHARGFVSHILGKAEFLLTPALPGGVPDWTQVLTGDPAFQPRKLLDLFSWMSFVNYLDLPAIVIPIGLDGRKRPICIQAIARPGQEARLLAFAHYVERTHPIAVPLLSTNP